MLDVVDFVTERGGDPKAVRESQRRRHAPEKAVEDVIALYEDHRKSITSMYLYRRELIGTLQPTMPPHKSVTR